MLTFIDTNIFLYTFDGRNRRKQETCQQAVKQLMATEEAVVSYQVIQEFAAVALRKFAASFTPFDLNLFLNQALWPICRVYPSSSLLSNAIDIAEETGWTFYDSLIVSSAERAGCSVLLSEDLQHDRKIRGVEIRNPFA